MYLLSVLKIGVWGVSNFKLEPGKYTATKWGKKEEKISIRRHQGLLLSLVSVAYTPGQSPEVSQARLWIMQWFGWSWSLLTCGAE